MIPGIAFESGWPSGGSEGLGFAIPIDRALKIADDLVRFGEVRRAWVGLDVEPVEVDDWGRTSGVRVARVAPGSPGDIAALEAGDRLLVANDIERALSQNFPPDAPGDVRTRYFAGQRDFQRRRVHAGRIRERPAKRCKLSRGIFAVAEPGQ